MDYLIYILIIHLLKKYKKRYEQFLTILNEHENGTY